MDIWTLAILGAGAVGKTALIIQLTSNYFFEDSYPTIEDSYGTHLVVDNQMCLLEIIDTAGGEEYGALRDGYVRLGRRRHGLILVSVNSRSSFEYLEKIHQSIRRVKGDNAIFILVGNKCDETQERKVSKADGAALARQYGCDFIETSAKTTQNVERLFINIVRSLRQASDTEPKQEPRQSAKKERKRCDCVIV